MNEYWGDSSQRDPAGLFRRSPLELLVIAALMALCGAFLLVAGLSVLPGAFRVIGEGAFGRAIGILLLLVCIELCGVAFAFLILAWRLPRADRVARGLTYVVLGALAVAILISNDHSTWLILTLVASIAAIAILAGSPNVQRHFAEHGKDADQPTPVVVARTLVAWWAAATLLVGVLFLPLASIEGKFVAVGLLFIGIAIAGFAVNGRLAMADRNARAVVSCLPVVVLIATLIAGSRSLSVLEPLAVSIGIVLLLWAPESSRQFFDGASAGGESPARYTQPAYRAGFPQPPRVVPPAPQPSSAGPARRRYCGACGTAVDLAWAHCTSCGAAIVSPTLPQQESASDAAVAAQTPLAPAAPEPPGAATPTAMSPGKAIGLPWRLLLDTGEFLDVDGAVLVGREPAPAPGETVDHLVMIEDDHASVSHTHLACGRDGDGVWVSDRNSTNGVVVETPDGERVACVPGERTSVPVGGRVCFGDRWFKAEVLSVDAVACDPGPSENLDRTVRRQPREA